LGVSNDREDIIRVTLNQKVKAIVSIDARLPNVFRFVVFLCLERRMSQIGEQKGNLLVEFFLDRPGQRCVLCRRAIGDCQVHLRFLRSAFTVFSAVLNGPT